MAEPNEKFAGIKEISRERTADQRSHKRFGPELLREYAYAARSTGRSVTSWPNDSSRRSENAGQANGPDRR